MMKGIDGWVYRFHTDAARAGAIGVADVDPAGTAAARVLRRLLRLPRPGVAVPTRVRVVRGWRGDAVQETWARTFGSARLDSTISRTGERVEERSGPVVLTMRREESDAWIRLASTGAAVAVGRLRLPLPRALAPRATARVDARGEDAFDVDVTVRLVLLGPLIAYRGRFTEDPGAEEGG